MYKIWLINIGLIFGSICTQASAEKNLGQAWVETMNACEEVISHQSFSGFRDYADGQSVLNVEPQLERGFRHPSLDVNASTISDGSEWFLCIVTGNTETEQAALIGALTGTLFSQTKEDGNLAMIFEDGQTLAPARIVCRDDGQLTSVFAYFVDGRELRVGATNTLPYGSKNPCIRN